MIELGYEYCEMEHEQEDVARFLLKLDQVYDIIIIKLENHEAMMCKINGEQSLCIHSTLFAMGYWETQAINPGTQRVLAKLFNRYFGVD